MGVGCEQSASPSPCCCGLPPSQPPCQPPGCSLMQRAVDLGLPAAMLTEQYRMHPAICAAVSLEFYE